MAELSIAEVRGTRVRRSADVVHRDDFSLGPARPLAAEQFVVERGAALYALDPASDSALFVLLRDPEHARAQPFFYEAQRAEATAVVRVPIAQLLTWADRTPVVCPPVLLFATARSGSTLLVRALDCVEGLCGVSEPDVFTQLAEDSRLADDARAVPIARACAALLFGVRNGTSPRMVLKFRTQVLAASAMLQAAWPTAPTIFAHRALLPSVESYLQAFVTARRGAYEAISPLLRRVRVRLDHRSFARRLWPPPGPPDLDELAALGDGYLAVAYWLAAHGWVTQMRLRGHGPLAVDYDTLTAAPASTMATVLEHCGIGRANVEATRSAFATHSQRGSQVVATARERPRLTASEVARLEAFIGAHGRRYGVVSVSPPSACPG